MSLLFSTFVYSTKIQPQHSFILILDMDATKRAIVAAADKPMSIIIVGVGKENFSGMKALDADGKRLSYEDKMASRDIVQFVGQYLS